jgi:hypothetical protein
MVSPRQLYKRVSTRQLCKRISPREISGLTCLQQDLTRAASQTQQTVRRKEEEDEGIVRGSLPCRL